MIVPRQRSSSSSSSLLLLLLSTAALISIDANALQDSGNQETKRTSRFQHLREQFEIFKRELDELLAESSNPEPVASVGLPQVGEPATNLEKRCQECDDSSLEKRCPSGCKKQKQQPQPHQRTGVKVLPQSEMMKRFLKALPEEDKRLVEGSPSKRQYIERLIRRTNHGPNADDVAAEKRKAEERVNAIADIGVRSMPAEDSSAMLAFKRSLSPADQHLLQKYKSKTRFIEGVLEKQTARDVRDVDVASKASSEVRRQIEDPVVAKYLQNLDDSQRALIEKHPSIVGRLKAAILKGTRDGEEKKRELSPDEIQSVLEQLASKEDRDVVKQHLSIIEKVAKAEKKPVGNPDEEVKQVVSRLASDIKIARKRGYDLEKLLVALKKRAEESKSVSEHK